MGVTCARCDAEPLTDCLVCGRCAAKALDAHYEIGALALQLDPYAGPAPDPDAPVIARSKTDTGPALINLTVAALLDPRTTWDGEPSSPRYWRAALTDWDNRAADALGLTRKPGTLRTWFDMLLGRDVIVEIVDEILGLRQQLAAAVGRPKRKEGARADVGRCACGGRLLVGDDLTPECGTCGQTVTSVTVADAALVLDCSQRSVWRAIAAGHLASTPGTGRVTLASLFAWRRCRLG